MGTFARFALVLAALCAWFAAGDASARDVLHLDWSAPAGCPTSDAVHAAAVRGAGAESAEPLLEASARATPLQIAGMTRWTVQLRTRRGGVTGERRLEARTCDGAAEATAVVLALALLSATPDTTETSNSAPAPPPPATTAPAPATVPPAAIAPPPATARAASRRLAPSNRARSSRTRAAFRRAPPRAPAMPEAPDVDAPPQPRSSEPRSSEPSSGELGSSEPAAHEVAFGASAAGDTATLPSPAIGAAFTLAWRPGRARIEIEARTWAAQTHTLDAWAAGARFAMTSLGARGCWAVWQSKRRSLDLAACGGADLQRVVAPGRGVDSSYDASALWAALAPGGLVGVQLTPWVRLRARLEGSIPLSRPLFVIKGAAPVHRPAALSAAGTVGVELSFF